MSDLPKTELLFPAGNLEKLKYAFAYGADAVYAGVPMFSLRARENQFTWESLAEGVEYTRKLGKKIYFTANIYAHNMKLAPFMKAFEKMYALKPDAYIMSDPGLIGMVREQYPDAEIHLSVQANNTNWAQVKFWHEQVGITRVILSRELSLREIREIHEKVPQVEIEFFVHGAICMAYSGRCLLSNYLSNRDPNQGVCSHSCRWEYKVFHQENNTDDLYDETLQSGNYEPLKGEYFLTEEMHPDQYLPVDEDEYGTYIMNARDMCLLDCLQDLREAGVVSFKIEGRSKTINYLAGVGRAYRRTLDDLEAGRVPDLDAYSPDIFAISNRGYTPGFIRGNLAEKSIYYDKNDEYHEEDFVGIIREYDVNRGMARLEVKNRFDLGEHVKIVMPEGVLEYNIDTILSSKDDAPQPSAHGGAWDVWINIPHDPGPWAILRRKTRDVSKSKVD
ncbi:MAG TPA: U32 family peptidase C-terminal domain-containing protein [bacterium]|nr:U32 family peptidase C-terminal domain-containing protein [bacterium]